MKLEEVNKRTKEAVDFLVAALESGHSEVLTTYLSLWPSSTPTASETFCSSQRRDPMPPTLPESVHGTHLAASLNAERRASSFSPRWSAIVGRARPKSRPTQTPTMQPMNASQKPNSSDFVPCTCSMSARRREKNSEPSPKCE